MKKSFYSFFTLSVIILLSGCASSGNRMNSNNAVNAQMGVLADEVTRLDMALQETRAQLAQEQARVAELQSRVGGSAPVSSNSFSEPVASYAPASSEPYAGIYRTPSGFEIPSASIQKALKGAGYYNGEIDGKIGPDTREAVRNFQRDNGLTPDGIVGKTTWGRLKTYLGSSGG